MLNVELFSANACDCELFSFGLFRTLTIQHLTLNIQHLTLVLNS